MARLDFDPEQFAAAFNARPFRISHQLTDHPLFTIPRLVQLAQDMSASGNDGSILYFHGDHDVNQVDTDVPIEERKRTFVERGLAKPDLSIAQVVEQIESCNAWMQIRNVGVDAEYAELLDGLINEFRPYAEPLAPGICGSRADIFVSSPGATTPFHMDEEHNFLLQLRGQKQIAIANGTNRDVVSESYLIDFFRGDAELTPYTKDFAQHSVYEDIRPGDGVHIPPCYPHWVQNGDNVSVSLGVIWHSDMTIDQRRLYTVNGWLRDMRLSPSPVGAVQWRDNLKLAPFRARRSLARAARKTLGIG